MRPRARPICPPKKNSPSQREEKADVTAIAEEYLRARYEVDYTTFLGADVFDFYTAHLSEAFLARDGITLASLGALEEEFKSYHVSIRLLSNTLSAAAQRPRFLTGKTMAITTMCRLNMPTRSLPIPHISPRKISLPQK